MKARLFAVLCLALAIGFLSAERSARASVAIPGLDDVTEVVTTPVSLASITELSCQDESGQTYTRYFNYLQLVAIPGFGKVWAPVEAVYPTGTRNAAFNSVCTDEEYTYYIYDLDPCAC